MDEKTIKLIALSLH